MKANAAAHPVTESMFHHRPLAEGILAVGALSRPSSPGAPFGIASFSNMNPRVSAPGVSILSTKVGGGMHRLNGTSMAGPHVAGVAALWAQKQMQDNGAIDVEDLRAKVVANAVTAQLPFDRSDIGAGLVQAPQN